MILPPDLREPQPESSPEKRTYFWGPEWFRPTQLSEQLIAIHEPHHFETVTSFLLETPDGSILFDTGMGLASIKAHIPDTKPVQVLLTHAHWDHTGCAHEFSNVAVYDHPFETNHLKNGWKAADTAEGYEAKNFTTLLPAEYRVPQVVVPGVETFSTFTDGQELTVFGKKIIVIHTPGHTPGSVCFFLPESGLLVTGDTIYPGPIYLHLPESSGAAYIQSLQKLVDLVGKHVTSLLPGHNAPQSPPELLSTMNNVLRGSISPTTEKDDSDEFGPHHVIGFENFSFRFPR